MTLNVTAIERISLNAVGQETNGDTTAPVFSPDGAKVLFLSDAAGLVPGVSGGAAQLFMKDLATGAVTLVSANIAGDAANRPVDSGAFSFSSDGTEVIFSTHADNLVPGDGNFDFDVFVKNLSTGAVTIVSTNVEGVQGDETSIEPSFSHDGTKITFMGDSFNFPNAPGDGDNNPQIYLKDLVTGDLTIVSADSLGTPGNSIGHTPVFSPDDTMIAFQSYATNLVPGHTVNNGDIFVKNLATGEIILVSTDSAGEPTFNTSFKPVWSPDGTKIAFESAPAGSDFSAIYIKDLATGTLTEVSRTVGGLPANAASSMPAWSPDGTYLAFVSRASNLVPYDNNHGREDVYVKDLITGAVSRLSVGSGGIAGDDASLHPAFSADGTRLVFSSAADNLVSGDTNGHQDVFMVSLTEDHVVRGSNNADALNGREDAELFQGREGNDTVHGNGGDDVIHGANGNDTLWGGNGDDRVLGEGDDDALHGGRGNDEVRGGAGNDVLYGDNGNDYLAGDNGNDALHGGKGADLLRGGAGDDALYGDSASDDLRGDAGHDTLNGGANADTLYGGADGDDFVFDATAFDGGFDTIRDFNRADGDTILLDHILTGYAEGASVLADFVALTGSGGSTLLQIDRDGSGSAFTFQTIAKIQGVTGLDAEDLHASGALTIT